MTMSAPAYQSRCARSNCGAGAAATDGTDDWRVARKSSRRLKLLSSSAPAATAARKSCSENCIEILRRESMPRTNGAGPIPSSRVVVARGSREVHGAGAPIGNDLPLNFSKVNGTRPLKARQQRGLTFSWAVRTILFKRYQGGANAEAQRLLDRNAARSGPCWHRWNRRSADLSKQANHHHRPV